MSHEKLSVNAMHYILPDDESEYDRLDIQAQHLLALMPNGIIHSPLQQHPNRILDVGCGTGAVTTMLAIANPSAKVMGLDIRPVPIRKGRGIPPNVQYVEGDILDAGMEGHISIQLPEEIRRGGFDLVYSRLLVGGITDWPQYIRSAVRLTKPSAGWVETHEIDLTWYDSCNNVISTSWGWLRAFEQQATKRGLDLRCGAKVSRWMEEAGLVDVEQVEYIWPFGANWEDTEAMKAFGKYVAEEIPGLFVRVMAMVTEGQGFSDEEYRRWCEEMRNDCKPEQGKHCKFYVTVGRRPGHDGGDDVL